MIVFNGRNLDFENSKPTPDEVYEAVLLAGEMAAVIRAISDCEKEPQEMQSILIGVEKILTMCDEILKFSLDCCMAKEEWKDVCWQRN